LLWEKELSRGHGGLQVPQGQYLCFICFQNDSVDFFFISVFFYSAHKGMLHLVSVESYYVLDKPWVDIVMGGFGPFYVMDVFDDLELELPLMGLLSN
jgi:hypothetical protein